MQPIVTGMLSYGMSGRIFHAPFVNLHPGLNLYAVTERNKKLAKLRYAEIISFDTIESLLSDEKIELVIVNTPNNTHYEFAKQALFAGKHVLVEKPFAAAPQQAKELFDIAKARGLKIMPYQNRRWDSDFLSFKNMLQGGKLGRIIEAHIRFDRYKKEIGAKTFKETLVPATGITYDLGPHLLDQAISIFGKPLKAIKTTGIYRPQSQVEDYLALHLIYPDSLNVYITATLLCAQPLPSFVAHGVNGSYSKERKDVQEAQLDNEILPSAQGYGVEPLGSEGVLTVIDDKKQKHTEKIASVKGDYMGLFDAVYEHIRNDKLFPVKEEEIIWQLEILGLPSIGL